MHSYLEKFYRVFTSHKKEVQEVTSKRLLQIIEHVIRERFGQLLVITLLVSAVGR